MRRYRLLVASSLASLLLLSACSGVQEGPLGIDTRPSLVVGERNEAFDMTRGGVVNACAFFPYFVDDFAENNSGRTTTLSASAPAGENVLGGNFSIQPAPSCIEIWNATDGDVIPVTASLVANHPGYEIERIVVASGDGIADPSVNTIYGTSSATVNVSDVIGGYIWFKFKKSALPPRGGQGCTPGYWKQEQHFDSWFGHTPGQAFGSVFDNAFPGMSMVQVASLGRGNLNALGRHAVAALLNASSPGVSYDLTPAQVISAFNAAYRSGNARRIEDQKNQFDMLNNQGCQLN